MKKMNSVEQKSAFQIRLDSLKKEEDELMEMKMLKIENNGDTTEVNNRLKIISLCKERIRQKMKETKEDIAMDEKSFNNEWAKTIKY